MPGPVFTTSGCLVPPVTYASSVQRERQQPLCVIRIRIIHSNENAEGEMRDCASESLNVTYFRKCQRDYIEDEIDLKRDKMYVEMLLS